jgi:hypothetical protein
MGAGELEIIAPLLMGVILILTVAGVILLKPLSKQLGTLLEAMARERSAPQVGEELGHMRDLLETINGRLSLLEERQDFTDAMLQDPERKSRRLGAASRERLEEETS